MKIQYQTQRLSIRFFMVMLVLFIAQVGFGIILGLQHSDPSFLKGILNFNVVRAEHLNLALLWILAGFIGGILYVSPLLSKRDLVSPWLIKFLFIAFCAVVVWNIFTQGLAMRGVAGWWAGQPWLQEGLEYVEAGRAADVVILIGFMILAYVVLRSFPKVKEWNEIHWGLGIGVTALLIVWLFGLFYVDRLDVQEYFRWFVVHYWVEGVWEVIHISLVGYLLVLMFDVDVKDVGYAVFWGVLLVWLSGLIGNAHHYFWIGTPAFWQFWGSLLSAFEPVPLIFCFWHVYLDAHQNNKPVQNMPAFYFILGSVVLEQVGAGILGFSMTFSLTNVWSHGTWITPAHGHLALFGTFGMLALAAAYYIIPVTRGIEKFDQRLGKLGFWILFAGILGIALCFALGGTNQIYAYRVLGLEWWGGDINTNAYGIYKFMLPILGFVFLVGACVVTYDLFTMGHRISYPVEKRFYRPSRWARYLTGFEAGMWLLAMWVFGLIVTFGLLSYNMDIVRVDGNRLLPQIMSWVGYVGLFIVTLLFVWRFLASLEARLTIKELGLEKEFTSVRIES